MNSVASATIGRVLEKYITMKMHRSIFQPFQFLYHLPFNSKLRLELTPRH